MNSQGKPRVLRAIHKAPSSLQGGEGGANSA